MGMPGWVTIVEPLVEISNYQEWEDAYIDQLIVQENGGPAPTLGKVLLDYRCDGDWDYEEIRAWAKARKYAESLGKSVYYNFDCWLGYSEIKPPEKGKEVLIIRPGRDDFKIYRDGSSTEALYSAWKSSPFEVVNILMKLGFEVFFEDS